MARTAAPFRYSLVDALLPAIRPHSVAPRARIVASAAFICTSRVLYYSAAVLICARGLPPRSRHFRSRLPSVFTTIDLPRVVGPFGS